MRMRNPFVFWLLGASLALPALTTAQVVQAVSVSQEQGQTLLTITGERLPRPSVRVWRRQFLVLEFSARFSGRGREVSQNTPHLTKLRYGWFSSRPPKVRVVATLRGSQPYTLEQTPTGWQVRIGKAMAQQVEASEPSDYKPVDAAPKATTVASARPTPPRTYAPESDTKRAGTPVAHTPEPPRPTPPPRILVSLDFVNAELGDVLKALAIQSGANIITAPDVKGTVTVSLTRLTVEESLNLITRLSGYRYEKIDNTYVVGTEESLKAFRASAEPVAAPKPRTVEALTFKVAKPTDIATYLSARFPELKVTPSGEKDATYLLIEGDAETVERAREAAYAFEQQLTGSVEIVTEVYRVKYADSRDLARIVTQLVPGVAVSLGPDALLSRGGAGGSGGAGGQQGEMTGGETPSATAQQMGAPMQGGGATAAQAAQPPNLLVLVGTAREVLRALELLRKVDVKQPQVIIEAKVLDVSEGSLKSLGLSWGFLQSGEVRRLDREGNAPFPIGDKRFPTQQSGGFNRDGQLGLDFNFVKKPIDFSVTLNALAEDRRNRLLASPRVATLDGRPATIFIGDEVNYVKLIQQTPQGANVQTDSVQAGIILRVLPRVHEDNSITLHIQPEVSVITGFLEVPGGGRLPQLARRNTDTTIRVNNGETVVIGGLIREADIKTIQRVPLLGDLPFLGYLFRRTNSNREKSEIIITLTVRVLDNLQ
jgi:general secretion pathway protein D